MRTIRSDAPAEPEDFGLIMGELREGQTDIRRRLAALNEPRDPPGNAKTAGYQSSLLVKSVPGVLYSIDGISNSDALAYIQFFDVRDVNAPPPDGAVPDFVIKVAITSGFSRDFGERGWRFDNGLWVVTSTTINAKTIGAASMLAYARFA